MVEEIFRYFIGEETPKKLSFCRWFKTNIPIKEFTQTSAILAHLIYKATDLSLILNQENISAFMKMYLKPFIAENSIKVQGTETLNLKDPIDLEKAYNISTEIIKYEFDLLISEVEYREEDFILTVTKFFQKQLQKRMAEIFSIGNQILSVGYDDKFGSVSALQYTKSEIEKLEYIYSEDKLKVISEQVDKETKQSKRLLLTSITAIDNDTLGLWSGQLWGIEADSGVGKTRFTLGLLVYRALLSKLNVLFCALEQDEEEVKSMLISRHVFNLYQIHIEDKLIYRNLVPAQFAEKVAIARYDLFESNNYGKLYISTDSLYANTLKDTFKVLNDFKGPFDLYVVDHMYLLKYKLMPYERYPERAEIISRGYREFKEYVKESDYAGIAINQLNREGSEFVSKDKCPPLTGAAGGIEVYRNTDYNIVLAQTPEMKAQFKMRLFNPKARASEGHISPIINALLHICFFSNSQTIKV